MKSSLAIAFAVLLLLSPASALAETVVVKVDGMVCDFCAQSIKKTFMKKEAVEDVTINLDDKTVTIRTKPDQNITDEEINKAVDFSGYTVNAIERAK